MLLEGAGGGEAAVCEYIKENNISIPPKVAKNIIAFIVLSLLDEKELDKALAVIEAAEQRGLLDDRLKSLGNKIRVLEAVSNDVSKLYDTVNNLLTNMSNNNNISSNMLNTLKNAISQAKQDFDKARNLGLQVDDKPILFAEDVYNIAKASQGSSSIMSDTKDLFNRFTDALKGLRNAGDIVEYGSMLQGLDYYGGRASKLMGEIDKYIRKLENVKVNTQQAKNIKNSLITSLQVLKDYARAVNNIAIPASVIGENLVTLMSLIKNAYTSPEESPLHGGGDRAGFVNAFTGIVRSAKHIKQYLSQIRLPESSIQQYFSQVQLPPSVSDNVKKSFNALKQAGEAISNSVFQILKNLKYSLTFEDYRWNEVWEDAESSAGVDLGSISKADVQKYEYKCDDSGCHLVERGGVLGKIMQHMPEQVLAFFTSVEDFLKYAEMYNRWIMNHSKNTALKALGTLGYMGAMVINAVGQVFAPRMLAENLKALGDMLGEWKKGIMDRSTSEISSAAHDTWNMFFGSKEAALGTLAMALLMVAAGGLATRGLPEGAKIPLRRAVLANLAQGDILGAGLVVVDRMLPLASLRDIAMGLADKGVLKVRDVAEDAELVSKIADKASKTSRVKAVLHIDDIQRITKKALKNSDSLREARENLGKYIQEEGLDNLKKDVEAYRASKQVVVSNLADLKINTPSVLEKIRRAVKEKFSRKPIVERELSAVSTEDLETIAKKKLAETPEGLVKELAEDRVLPRTTLDGISALEDTVKDLEKAGRPDLAEAFRRIEENLGKLKGEIARLEEVKKSLDGLEEIRKLAEDRNLWRDTVRLNRRKYLVKPEEIKSLSQYLDKYKEEVTRELESKRAKASELENALKRMKLSLSNEGMAISKETLKPLAEALRDLGYKDLAEQAEKLAKGEGAGVLGGLSNIIGKLGEKLAGDSLREAREIRLPEAEELFKQSRLPEALKAPYILGVKTAHALGRKLLELSEKLKGTSLVLQEKNLINKIASTLEKEYKGSVRDNIAFLEGLKKGLEGFEKTPIGAMLTDLEGAFSEALRVYESRPEWLQLKAREQALENLRQVFSIRNKEFYKTITGLSTKVDELASKMRESLAGVEGGSRVLGFVDRLVERTGLTSVSDIVEEARRMASEEGYRVPEEFWGKLEEYLETASLENKLKGMLDRLEKGTVTLDEIQDAIDSLAHLNLDVTWKADWAVISGYLSELARELDSVKNLAGKDLALRIEEAENTIKQALEKKFKEMPIEETEETLALAKDYSLVASTIDNVADVLARALGEDKVRGLRDLVNEFKKKLAKGEYDESLLKKIRWEIRKLKLKNLPTKIRADLTRLASKLRELATRLGKGKQAGLMEKALNQLADDIVAVEESMPEVEGWVRVSRLLGVEKGKILAVPKELADRIAEIFNTKKKELNIHTREGFDVKLRRKVEITGDNNLDIRYELEFPGKRKIVYEEVSKADPEGHVYVYRNITYDPPAEKALAKYEQAEKTGEYTEEAKIGEAIDEILRKPLEELDPDYKILKKISIITEEGVKPLPLEAGVTAEILSKLYTPLLASTIAGEGQQLLQELEAKLPAGLKAEVEKALEKFKEGEEAPLLSLLKPITDKLGEAYTRLLPPDALPDYTELQQEIGNIEAGGLLPEDWSIASQVQGGDVYLVVPKPSPEVIGEFEKPNYTVTITLPDGNTITLPAVYINNHLYIILPPFSIKIPEEYRATIEGELEKQKLKPLTAQAPALHPKPVPPITGGAGAPLPPPPPPPIPVLPWEALGVASASIQKEKIHI